MGEQELSVEQEAAHMGWVPQDQFRGDPEKWVDAETFVRRGQEIMPILRANNKELHGKVGTLESTISDMRAKLDAALSSVEAMKELQVKAVKDAVKRTKDEVLSGIRAAKEAGDIDAEMALTEQLTEVNQQIKDLDATPPKKDAPATPAQPNLRDPSLVSWLEANPWFDKDPVKTGLAMGLAQQLKSDEHTAGLTGKAFFDMLDEKLAEFSPSRRAAPSRVEGSRGTGQGSSDGGGKGYNALPAEAKAECERDAARFVGEGKAFKTIAEWRGHFANLYFAGE